MADKDIDRIESGGVEPKMPASAIVAFTGMDLKQLREYMENLRGSWNGEDSKFIHEGEIYHEDHVSAAEEIIEKIDELQEILNEF